MEEIFKVFARSKSVEILLALENKKLKFNEVVKIAGNPTTAMRRTQDLQATGLIKRRVLQDRQRSVQYALTQEGKALIPLLKRMAELKRKS